MHGEARRWQQVRALFDRAVELDPAARAAFLDEACGADRELRGEVDALLAVDDRDVALPDGADPWLAVVGQAAGRITPFPVVCWSKRR